MAAKFEIRSPRPGQYVWILTSQGRTLATSGPYSRRAAAEKAIVSFRMVAVNAPVLDTTVPAAKPSTRKAARTTGRVVAKAVVKGGRTVQKAEKVTKRAAKRATRVARTAAKAATDERGRTGSRTSSR